MDGRFIYIPSRSPASSSPIEDSEQCLFEELPFLHYEKEEEIIDTVPDNDVKPQHIFYHHSQETSEHAVAAEYLVQEMKTKKDTWTSTGDICYVLPKTGALSPHFRYKTSAAKKDRTPRTALRMMERHRENERTRHHNLNDSLSEICKRVPGAHQDGRETKVVMMQRIISYVAYLENTIVNLCSELDIPYKKTLTPLTLQLRKEMEKRSLYDNKEILQITTKAKKPSCRKLKLSSPTIDSTSDHQVPQHTPASTASLPRQDGSQDSMVPSSTFVPLLNDNALSPWLFSTQGEEEDVLDTCGFETLFGQEAEENNGLQMPNALASLSSPRALLRQQEVPEPLQLLSSPDLKGFNKENVSTFNLGGNVMTISRSDRYGSEKDTSFDPDMPDSLAVSPDTVLPTIQIPSSSSAFFSPVQSASLLYKPAPLTPATRRNKRKQYTPKQYTPKRPPFSNISNLSENIDYKREDDQSDDEESTSLHSLGLTRHQKAEIALLESRNSRPPSFSSDGSNIAKRTGKTDLRKTSWMNGFMMFSRLNRRKFIESNPGVHTSNISKIMGHAWRNMSAEEQNPYREKAKLCAQELQRQQQLPEEFVVSPTISSSENEKSNLFDSGFASASSYLALEDST